MNVLLVDDEVPALEVLKEAVSGALPDAQVGAFLKPKEALLYAKENPCEIAFLDIEMRGMSGVELAKQLKEIYPQINLIFVTGYGEFTGEAMAMHASGYIRKPVSIRQLKKELEDLRYPLFGETDQREQGRKLLKVKCLGNFDVYTADGNEVHFARSKSREAFAYLVNKCGASCTVREIAALLFEDEPYDRRQRGYMQKILSSMIIALRENGAEEVIIKQYNSLAVDTSLIDCDYYRFLAGEMEVISSWQGEYMSCYSWAESSTGYLNEMYKMKMKQNSVRQKS